jgi:hypothetical protein
MNHAILFFLCIFSLELLIKLNFLNNFFLSFVTLQKTFKVLMSANISDHWKEIIIPTYAFSVIIYSLKNIITFTIIIFCFLIFIFLIEDFLYFIFSFRGIVESILFIFSYIKLRKFFAKK